MKEKGLEEDRQLPVRDEEDGDGQGSLPGLAARPNHGASNGVGLPRRKQVNRHRSVILTAITVTDNSHRARPASGELKRESRQDAKDARE
jgi:hypothetical protein